MQTQTQHNSKDLRSHEETGCKDSNKFQSDASHGRVYQSKMNEQVRTLNERSSSSPPFQPPELPSDSVATNLLLGSVEKILLTTEPGYFEPAPERQSREAGGRGCGSLRALS